MSTLQDSDLFIVDRNGNNYQLPNSQMSTVQDTDLFVVERDGVNYKVEGKDLSLASGYFDTPVEVLTPLNGAGLNDGESYTPKSSVLVSTDPVEVVPNFSTTLYDGNDTDRVIETNIDNTNKALVWIKVRDYDGYNHALYDTERGVNNELSCNNASDQTEYGDKAVLYSFDSNGFKLGTSGNVNSSGYKFVAWNFKAAPGFMDVVTYENDGSTVSLNIPHSLGVTPAVIIQKPTDSSGNWWVYHKDLPDATNNFLTLDNDLAANGNAGTNIWNPTPTTFDVNQTSRKANAVAYLFADTPGKIKCGSHPGLGQVDCGFKPGWLLLKNKEIGDWYIVDSKRTGSYGSLPELLADTVAAEGAASGITFNDTGFDNQNTGGDFIYVAIAETPDTSNDLSLVFQDDTELKNIIGPVRMVDENGEVKTPVTSAVTGVTSLTGASYFSTTTYPGTGTSQPITTGVDNTDGKSLIWIKNRDVSTNHNLVDTERGSSNNLASNSSNNQVTDVVISSFSSDGFELASSGQNSIANFGGENYVAWNFKAAPGFMDIVTYDGEGVTQSIPHSLGSGSVPGMIIVKGTNGGSDWTVYHRNLNGGSSPEDWYLSLNHPFSESDAVANWGGTAPTATEFTVSGNINASLNYVAYLFADTPGKIKCGGYSGNNEQQLIDCGFKPEFVMVKNVTANANWQMFDRPRGTDYLQANGTQPEAQFGSFFAWTNNGYECVQASTALNALGNDYIYVAIAEDAGSPDTTALTLTDSTDLAFFSPGDAVTGPAGTPTTEDVFTTTLYNGNDASNRPVTTNIDNTDKALVWLKCRTNSSGSNSLFDTVRGAEENLNTGGTGAQATKSEMLNEFTSDGFVLGGQSLDGNASGNTYVAWNFRGAPGFMDIVTYEGNSTPGRIVPHSLGSAPGMMIVKKTNNTGNWAVYHKETGADQAMYIQSSNEKFASSLWNNTAPTDAGFTLNNGGDVNRTGDEYVAYLFADTPGKIKCGQFPSNETAQVDAGFEPGWILFKGSDVASNWYIFDSTRGISTSVNGKTPFVVANDNQKEYETSGLWIEPGTPNIIRTDSNFQSANFIYVAIAKGVTAEVFPPRASGEVVSSNPSGPTLELSNVTGTWSNGAIATGPLLNTVSDNVISQQGNTLGVSDTTGNWLPGLYAEGATITSSAPSPQDIVFTSMNDGTTPVTGVDATLARRKWTLEKSDSASGPWVVVGVYNDSAANASQDGATPWGNPPLTPNTFYQVKVMYESGNANSVESLYNTFKTGDA